MRSWLRKAAGLLSSRPDPRQSTPDEWRPEDFTPAAETAAAPDPWADTTSHPPASSGPQPPPPAATTPRSVQPIEVRRDHGTATPVDPPPRIPEQPDLGASTETPSPSSPAAAEAPRRSAAAAPDPASEGLPGLGRGRLRHGHVASAGRRETARSGCRCGHPAGACRAGRIRRVPVQRRSAGLRPDAQPAARL